MNPPDPLWFASAPLNFYFSQLNFCCLENRIICDLVCVCRSTLHVWFHFLLLSRGILKKSGNVFVVWKVYIFVVIQDWILENNFFMHSNLACHSDLQRIVIVGMVSGWKDKSWPMWKWTYDIEDTLDMRG